jgi:putative transposase
MPVPIRPNDRWSMDFVADTFGAFRQLRILAINYACYRENLCLLGDTSISGICVTREFDTLVRLYGKTACIVSDNVLGREAALENDQRVSLRRGWSALVAF